MNKSSKLTKIENVAKRTEIPAPVLKHIRHLERCKRAALKRSDWKSYEEFQNRLVAYKKRNGVS